MNAGVKPPVYEYMKKGGAKTTGGNTRIWIGIVMLLILELFVYTWSRVQCVGTGYEISRATADHKAAVAERNKLAIELAHLNSPKRIAKIAGKELGLSMPKPEQIILIGRQ